MVKKFIYAAMLVAMICAIALPAAMALEKAPVVPGSELVVADFDSGEKPNNIGGDFGAWSKDPTDFSQGCTESFDSVNRDGSKGFGMKLEYSVESKNPAYNGFWMFLQNLDASKYDNVAIKVKGDAKIGYTTVFKVELKNAAKQVGRYYVTNITDQWQDVVIPLKDFKGITDFSNLTEFVIVFEDRIASNKKGVVYVDDLRFTKNK
ncbi:MAG: CIA30 family protein [Candidatus Omnitrophota bacterium]|nr:CIA30 family protein [Candidatus Omnitrophota bacterium]